MWDLLREEVANRPQPRPANSVTAEELALQMDVSRCYAAAVLDRKSRGPNPQLKKVEYKNEGRRRSICYVPVTQ